MGSQIPAVLFAYDLAKTACFYKEQLGFSIRNTDGVLAVKRDDIDVRIYQAKVTQHIENMSVILTVPDARGLHEEYSKRKVISLSPLEVRRHRPLQFGVSDINGNTLIFAGRKTELVLVQDEQDTHATGALRAAE